MSNVLIDHGEKMAIGAIALGCAWVLVTTYTDQSIRPAPLDNSGTGTSAEKFKEVNERIDKVFKTQQPPRMKQPRTYVEELRTRLARQVPATPAMAWVTARPDLGRTGNDGFYPYIYEILAPKVAVADKLGSLELTINLPESSPGTGEKRISSAARQEWVRKDGTDIRNSAMHLAVLIEMKVGDGKWGLLQLKDMPEGILPLTKLGSGKLTFPTPQPWQTHQFRATLLAGATGFSGKLEPGQRPKASILVHAGAVDLTGKSEDLIINEVREGVQRPDPDKILARFQKPLPTVPAGVVLPAGMSLYQGLASPEVNVIATASLRFAFAGISQENDAADPTKTTPVARFLLTKQFEKGDERKWLTKPVAVKTRIDEEIGRVKDGEKFLIEDPFSGKKLDKAVEMRTGFVVTGMAQAKRTLYYEVKFRPRAGGGKQKELVLPIPVSERSTDVVTIKNIATGTVSNLTKLGTIQVRENQTDIYPRLSGNVNEDADFAKNPSGFKQQELTPRAPTVHQPGTGPLEDLRIKTKDDLCATDTAYVEMPDGRLIWWEPNNTTVSRFIPPELEAPKTEVPPPADPGAPTSQPAPPAPVPPK